MFSCSNTILEKKADINLQKVCVYNVFIYISIYSSPWNPLQCEITTNNLHIFLALLMAVLNTNTNNEFSEHFPTREYEKKVGWFDWLLLLLLLNMWNWAYVLHLIRKI